MLSRFSGAGQGADVCLSDFCELLHCEAVARQLGRRHQAHGMHNTHAPCRPSKMAILKEDCRQMAQRCFPAFSGPAAVALHGVRSRLRLDRSPSPWKGCTGLSRSWCAGWFLDAFCTGHTCREGKGGQRRSSSSRQMGPPLLPVNGMQGLVC